ncbi:MAG: SRPBCC family protein [Candidatus Melainabacteria bacterium]
MTRFNRITLALLLPACLMLGAALPALAAKPHDINVSVLSPTRPTKTIKTRTVINAPPHVVWKTLTSYNNLKNIIPEYRRSTILANSGTTKTVDIGLKVSQVLPTYNYQVRVNENQPQWTLNVNRISGDFSELSALYKLVGMNNNKQTMLVYDLNINPGNNLPGAAAVIQNSTRSQLTALQTHIERAYRQGQ